ncbi:MAG TPA: GntR family transcriptional regulator [Candidatus Limnocylindria bacterium]|nr:GntR family transcriptional regulator [Candidatus Limnocylindria bacterium]
MARQLAEGTTAESRPLDPLRSPSLVELAYRSIRDSILTGRLQMGSRLLDVRLANELEVSRGTVRDALGRLVDEGLVIEQPRQGMFVREFGPRDVIDIYNVRIALEPVAARLVVRNGFDAPALQSILDRMRAAAEEGDIPTVSAMELAFHLEICTQSQNQHLVDCYRMIQSRVRMALSLDNRGNEDYRSIAERHEPLLAALASNDEHRAAAAAHAHIVGHVDEVLIRLGADPADLLAPAG